jgi:UDP-N-acetylglucosamine/UDP-N-acetylgalactosamine diphosphorylase
MKATGIKYIHYCPVDNVLIKLADPTWAGFMELKSLQLSSKSLRKAHAHEKVGIHALVDGKPAIVGMFRTIINS